MARAKNEEFNQIKYQNEFKKANYDRVEILVKKGERAIIKEIAAAAGQNVSEYINQAIKERMERDQRMTAEELYNNGRRPFQSGRDSARCGYIVILQVQDHRIHFRKVFLCRGL